jgi:hypothetical protein
MPRFLPLIAIVLAAGFVFAASAYAQTPQAPRAPDVATEAFNAKSITARQWNRMKKRWMRDKVKWEACNRQARARGLSGRRSWPVIAQCMTAK